MNISDLKTDQNNFNKHTEIGTKLLEKSLRKFGGARSIVIDKNNNVVAGNGTVETAMSIGLTNVRVIETDGTEIIAVKRTDFDLENDIKTKEYALADNQVAVKNIMIDSEMVIDDLGEQIAEDWVVEQTQVLQDDGGEKQKNVLRVYVECTSEEHQNEVWNKICDIGLDAKIETK